MDNEQEQIVKLEEKRLATYQWSGKEIKLPES